MKLNKIKIGILLTIASVLISCSEEFIDLAPQSDLGANGFYRNAKDIEQAVIASYASLTSNGEYNYNFPHLFEMRSDNSTIEDAARSGARYGQIDEFILVTSNPVIQSTWRACYETIKRTNIVIDRIDGIEMESATKNARKGEVLFIRALTYFNLVRIYGGVPLVVNEIKDPTSQFGVGRSTVGEVYTQIEDDLVMAVGLLPTVADDKGRVTKGAAEALLGKVYLTTKEYTKAVEVLNNLITSSTYSLVPNYTDIFREENENNKESIFEVQFKAGDGDGSRFPNLFAPTGATDLIGNVGSTIGDNIPTTSLLNAYEVGDLRKDASVGQLTDNRYYTKKYLGTPVSNYDSGVNSIVLRYADILLMQAEALNEIGYATSGSAYTYLNLVRTRAGLPVLTSSTLTDQITFRNAVLKERRVELAFENHRWADLVRTNMAIAAMNDVGYTIQEYQLLYPIPADEISRNPDALTQNPGY